MSTPPSSNSKAGFFLPPEPQSRKFKSIIRPLQKKFWPVVLAALLILLAGCANVEAGSPQQPLPEERAASQTTNSNNSIQLATPPAHPVSAPTSTVAVLHSSQNSSTPTPFSLPEPTLTPKPTSTPTRVFIEVPTSTPTSSSALTSLNGVNFSEPGAPNINHNADTAEFIPLEYKLDLLKRPTATSFPTLTPTPILPVTNLPIAVFTPTITTTIQSGIKHVVIISIDGLRPDAVDLADTPILDDLRARGAYSPQAQTVLPSKTLPSHASMLSGMVPEKHGIQWSMPYIGWPGMNGPTLFSVAHEAGLTTAMVFGKEKLNYIVLPNSVDEIFGQDVHDTEVKDRAIEIIQTGLPHLLFVHFPDTDRVGHEFGWMSTNQLYSVTFVDGLIGEIVAALENGGYLNNTLLIVTADHGGHGTGHGDDSPLDRTIPWLAVGPGVPHGITLTGPINTYDTAATAAYVLKLPRPEVWDGQPILEIFE